MAQLAQTYIHVKIDHLSDQDFYALVERLEIKATEIAFTVYGRDYDINIRIEEGSLKSWFTVIGPIVGGLYFGIAAFPEFEKGVIKLANYANSFGDKIIEMVESETATSGDDIIHKSRRKKSALRLRKITDNIDELSRSEDKFTKKQRQLLIDDIYRQLYKLTEESNEEEMQTIIDSLPKNRIPQLPDSPSDIRPPVAALKPEFDSEYPHAEKREMRRAFYKLPQTDHGPQKDIGPNTAKRKYDNTISIRDKF